MSQNSVAWAPQPVRRRPACVTAPRQELCPLHRGLITGCPLHHGNLGSLAHLPQSTSTASPKRDPSNTSWWTQARLGPCQGRHLLQEGFGLSSSPVLRGQGAGHDVIPFEAGLRTRFVPKQVVQRAGPACDSLDHRAGACYLPCSLRTMNFVMPSAFASLLVPPSAFWTYFALSQSGVPSFCSKNRCTSFTN